FQILVAQDIRQHVKLLLSLGVFKHHRLDEIKIKLLLVHHVKYDHVVASKSQMLKSLDHEGLEHLRFRGNDVIVFHVVASKSQMLKSLDHARRVVIKIGDQHDDAAAREQLGSAIQKIGNRSLSRGRKPLDY